MDAELIRRCPSCNAEHPPSVMRCSCGALLAGVDLLSRQALVPNAVDLSNPLPEGEGDKADRSLSGAEANLGFDSAQPTDVLLTQTSSEPLICQFDDCGQTNPPGSKTCLYCNRPLNHAAALTPPDQLRSLLNLPAALKDRYRIVRPLPTRGAEAELLLVELLEGGDLSDTEPQPSLRSPFGRGQGEGEETQPAASASRPPTRVAKIYRHGILPKPEVQERIAKVAVEHRVAVFETGVSEGYAYEVMELCAGGSLRRLMEHGPLATEQLYVLVQELATALSGVHAVGLVHRDMKPENILIRSEQPLDLVLTDFSISSILDATQRFTGVARTMPYASPESLSGVIDTKADYWALGMIVLECALGKHPFAGLSEAVILHHLTTRNIDLSGVVDGKTRKLLRGLLLRDPKLRWGNAEIQRWQADDISLAEPADQTNRSDFAEPYHIASEICHTPEQLAVALARHWQEGVADLENGQLLGWFRDTRKDQNVVRLLLDNKFEKKLPVDVQLLKLILHLAPGIPPVWRGETIELPHILAQANLALKGDADAVTWLDKLYRHRVLEVYAQAGNRQAFDLVQRWSRACDQFAEAWQEKLTVIKSEAPEQHYLEIVNFGQLQYGMDQPDRPPIAKLHARMLAIAYDASWAERLRQRLINQLSGLSAHCSWLVALGDPRSMDAAGLLVLEALLPEARKVVELQLKAEARRRETELNEYNALRKQAIALISAMRKTARNRWATPGVCNELSATIEQYLALVARAYSSGRTDTDWQEMVRFAVQSKIAARVMLAELHELIEHRAASRGWLSIPVLRFASICSAGAFLLFPGVKTLYFVAMAALAAIAWRLVPDFLKMQKIRKLAKSL